MGGRGAGKALTAGSLALEPGRVKRRRACSPPIGVARFLNPSRAQVQVIELEGPHRSAAPAREGLEHLLA